MANPALILHLEDSDLDAVLIADRLAKTAPWASIERAATREEFLAALTRGGHDLILSDFQVPGFSGFEALDLSLEHRPDTPFVFLSGALGEEVAVEALRRGARDYILKERMIRLAPAIDRALTEARERVNRRLTEERLRLALTAGRMGTWRLDLANGVLDASPTCKSNYGRAGDEPFTYADLRAAIHPDDRDDWTRVVSEAIETATEFAIEYRTVWPDGAIHWVHVRGACVLVNEQAVSLSGVSFDITGRKASELERERLGEELARREEELRVLTDAIPALISYVDTNCVYRFANRAYEAWFGRPRSEIIGRHMSDVLGEPAYRIVQPVVEAALQGEPKELETFAPYRDGGARHIHVHYVPRLEKGVVVGCYVLVNDITARKINEQRLHESEAQLKEADRRKDEFLATLAHELRNPLAPIYSGLRLMRVARADVKVVDQARDMIERQATQLKRLVDDLMDVSRISRGLMELRKEVVDLRTVVNAAIEASRPLIDQRGHELVVSLPEAPTHLDADPVRVTQVLMNLLNNAAKYSDRGGHIRLHAEHCGTDVVISVEDRGIGIPADRLEDIFEIFSQVDRSIEKSHGGLGIGLSLVKRLIEMHGGSIEARSAGPGTGSQFILTLPLHRTQTQADAQVDPQTASRDGSHRILVVDDNREAADSLAQLLQLMGQDTRAAYDGESAIAEAAEFRPEVILLDIGMPRLNGLDACRRIRQQSWGRDITLIALTGWGQQEDVKRSREAGFDEHMVKPVDAERLLAFLDARAPLTDSR